MGFHYDDEASKCPECGDQYGWAECAEHGEGCYASECACGIQCDEDDKEAENV
jgi:hypothetical protein